MSRLIIDTDVATGVWHEGRPRDVDDGFAIATAMTADDLKLIGITTTYGNAPITETTRVATELVDAAASDIPVTRGAAVPLDQSGRPPLQSNEAVEFIADQLRDGPTAIAAIGPLTNIGILAGCYPELMPNVQPLIIVAGRSRGRAFYLGDTGPVRDFNFENDVQAAQLALQAAPKVVMAGFELTSQVAISEQDLAAIGRRDSPLAAYLYSRSVDWMKQWRSRFPDDIGFHPWDSATVAWLRRPGWFEVESRGWQITEIEPGRYWLETDPAFDGPRIIYCTGFAPGCARQFTEEIVATAGQET
ncbi:MAG: nucleoside hydrolase [Gammaproteobacteria bacterium]|nr:nucleoside hydrolase [Gammaproteobacteria bacterium]